MDSCVIDSPKENGQYLIDNDLAPNGRECWSVFFRKYGNDDWETQKTFLTKSVAIEWVHEEIMKFN